MSLRDQAGRPSAASKQEENQIDLTPMLDVVFIMLIFFIVTSSFVKEPGIEIFKPQAETTEACLRGTIIFAVDTRGDIYYNKNKLPLDRALRTAEAAKKDHDALRAQADAKIAADPSWAVGLRPQLLAIRSMQPDEANKACVALIAEIEKD